MGRTKRPSTPRLDTLVIKDTQGFAALEKEWEDLYRNAPLATPFQSWAWLYSWWESYGEDYDLRLVTVRDGSLLVGLLPLMLERRWGFGRLLFIGSGPTDYLDILAREGWEARVAEAGVNVLRRMDSWHVADLQELRPEAASWNFFREWAGPRTDVRQSGCPVIDIKPWDELLMSLSKNRRNAARKAIRRVEADGIYRKLVDVTDVERAARRLVALHRELWRERDNVPEHQTKKFESLVTTAAPRLVACGLGGISEFWQGGETTISSFWLSGHDFVGMYIVGVSLEALRRYQWSSICFWDAVNVAHSRGSARLDLLRGEEPYKLRWASEVISTYRVLLGRDRASFALYNAYHLLRSKATGYAKSEDTPVWVKEAETRYRRHR